MGTEELHVVECYKYLGLSIDRGLTFEQAYKDVNQKVNSRLFKFSKLRENMTHKVAILLYKTMIMSLFDYACFAYEGCNKDNLLKLQRLQNRGLGICFRKNRGVKTNVDDMHTSSGVPKLERRRQELLLSLMYKNSHEAKWVDERPRARVTRSINKIRFTTQRHNSALYTKSPLYRGCVLWDRLGDWYQNSESRFKFKKRIRSCVDLTVRNDNPSIDDMLDESLVVEDI